MDILSYIKNIIDKVENLDYAVENPICAHNPFCSIGSKTYVWVEKEEKDK